MCIILKNQLPQFVLLGILLAVAVSCNQTQFDEEDQGLGDA